jgi:release factor glutamine methyltransferase
MTDHEKPVNPPARQAPDDWTIARLTQATADWFGRLGIETPRLEAEILLAHVLGCRRIDLYATWTDSVDDRHRAALRELVRRRAAKEPTAYLVGFREFHSLRFKVTRDVLIPRPETELLVEKGLGFAKSEGYRRFADLGTGTGAIAVTLAKFHPEFVGVAVEVSPAAAEVARENAQTNGVTERVDVRVGDLFAPLAGEEPFDLLVSNPPYVREGEWPGLDAEVRMEPRLALTAGADGLDVIRRIVAGASSVLRPGGRLLLEHGAEQKEGVEGLIRAQAVLEFLGTVNDLAGHPRVASVRRRT